MASNLPLTYPDIVCIDDVDPYASETTSDFQSLQQDIHHLLLELPGSNPDDPDRGIGVLQYLSGTADDLGKLGGRIDSQLRSDDRVTSSKTTVEQLPTGGFLVSMQINVGPDIIPLQYGVSPNGIDLL